MKTLLIKPNDNSVVEINGTCNFTMYGEKVMPWSLAVLASLLRQNGDDVFFLDAQALNLDPLTVRQYIHKIHPDRVIAPINPICFNRSTSFLESLDVEVIILINKPFCQWVTEQLPRSQVIYGDWFSSIIGNQLLIDEYPPPAFDLLPMHLYTQLQIMMSEGCNHQCNFCHFGRLLNRPWRCRSISSIISELKSLRYFGMKFIRIFDNEFSSDVVFAKELLRTIIRSKMTLFWETNIRASNADEELISLMFQAGCVYTGFGIECADQKVLNLNKKAITLEQIRTTSRILRKHHIPARLYTLLGMMHADALSITNTIEFIEKDIRNQDATFDMIIPFPNTDYFQHLLFNGKIRSPIKPSNITWIEKYIYNNQMLSGEKAEKPEWDYDCISFDEACSWSSRLKSKPKFQSSLRKLSSILYHGSTGFKFAVGEFKAPNRILKRLCNL